MQDLILKIAKYAKNAEKMKKRKKGKVLQKVDKNLVNLNKILTKCKKHV